MELRFDFLKFVDTSYTNMKRIITLLAILCSSQLVWSHGDIHHDFDPLQQRFMNDSRRLPDYKYQQSLREQPSWKQFIQQNGDWWVQFNETNARPHRAFGTPIDLQLTSSPAAAGLYFLNTYLPNYLPASVSLEFISAPVSKKYIHTNYIQKHNGIEVLWSRATVKMTHDMKVVMFGLDVYDDINISTTPTITSAQAIMEASKGIVSAITGTFAQPDLKILPVPGYRGNKYHLVYEVNIRTSADGQTPDDYYTLVDAMTGEVLYRTDKIVSFANSDITMTGTVYPTHPYNATAIVNLPYLKVTVGGTDYNTDVNGLLNLPNTSPFNATFTLAGPWATVYTGATSTTVQSFTSTVNPGPNTISFDNSSTVRHLSAYYHTNIVHDFMNSKLASFTSLDYPLDVRVDRTDGTCNAFYNGTSINFYTTAGGCYALSMVADVIYHEYGHGITDKFWDANGLSFSNGGMGEGYSDVWAISITNNPVLGIGFSDTDPTANVRNYDFNNNVSRKVYPQNIIGEVHADGEIIAGAWWSTALLLGSTPLMTDLFTESHYGLANGPNGAEGQVYTDILIDALQADDTDGNLNNGTPNITAITQGFAQHGITLLSNATLNHTPVVTSTPGIDVTLNASLTNLQFAWALAGVKGAYKINNGSWNPFTLANTGGNSYSGTIPAQPAGTLISYYIGIEDINGILSNVQPVGANVTANPNIPYFTMVGFNLIFTDDFDITSGQWVEGLATDGATTGMWEQNGPEQTLVGAGVVQPNYQVTPGGFVCYVTGGVAGTTGAGDYDVDGGATTLTSPTYDLSSYTNPTFEYYRWYTNDQGATPGTDFWQVYISNDGTNYIPVEYTTVADHSWRRFVFRVTDYLPTSSTFTVRFIAEDANAGSLIEALMDEFSLYDGPSTTSIAENNDFTLLQVWPNPAQDLLQVNAVLKNAAAYQLNIIDAVGKVVHSEYIKLNSGSSSFQLPVHQLANGFYHLSLMGEKGTKNIKFSVAH